jgi:hypothetical protein
LYGVPRSVCNRSVDFDDGHLLVVISEVFDTSLDFVGILKSG